MWDRKYILINRNQKKIMNSQSRKKIITAEGSIAPKSTIILVFSHQGQIVRGANFLVTMPTRSIDQLLELNNNQDRICS